MSGFTVDLDRGGSGIDPDRLREMQTAIDHRGPDGSDVWVDNSVGLGHQKLVTTPEGEYDEQPCEMGKYVLAADARLDNRDLLESELVDHRPPERVPDSHLLLDAYREWGPDCVDRLVGDFAFVIWDREEGHVFCARDHFGIKPFYYHAGPGQFAAASEKKALVRLPSVPTALDERKIGDFLVDSYEDTTRTFFEGIRRLPPAHAMTVDATGIETWQYWDLDPSRTLTFDSDTAYEQRFRELFETAVGSRLRTRDGVGAALSGGIDSSSITVMARELLPQDEPLYTFSNVFDDAPASDEREFIETVIDRDGIESAFVPMDGVGALVDKSELRRYFDQPPHNTLHCAEWERTKRAAKTNVDTVLGGALGDSAIGYGLGLLPELLWRGRWRHLYRELTQMSEIIGASVRDLFVRHVLADVVPPQMKDLRNRLKGEPTSIEAANATVKRSFSDRIDLRQRYSDPDRRGATFTPRDRRRQRRSLLTGKNATNFETIDLVHAPFGIEPRFPFADRRLVEFSLAIPPTQQFKDGWTRSIVRRALADILPEKIQWRPWKTFLNQGVWNALTREEERLEALIEDPGLVAQYVDIEELAGALERFQQEPNTADARALWRALSLSVFFEAYEHCP